MALTLRRHVLSWLVCLLCFSIQPSAFAARSKDTHVSGYTRKDGTYVGAYDRASPGSSSSSSDDKLMFVFAILGAMVVVGVASAIANTVRKSKDRARVPLLAKEAADFFQRIGQTGTLPSPETPVILAEDEKACLHEHATLIEARSSRVFGGAGTRIHGIWVGGGGSTPVQALRQLDSGTLTLTNKRLVFNGSMESRVVDVRDIVSVEPFVDAIEITTKKRAKRQVYTVRNPFIWSEFVKMILRGDVKVSAVPRNTQPPGPHYEDQVEQWERQTREKESQPGCIKFSCSNCGQPIEAENEQAGQAASCPTCKSALVIPNVNG